MPADLCVSGLRFTPASRSDREAGRLGFLEFDLAGLVRIDGVTLRRTVDNQLMLGFPSRCDSRGVQHDYVRPVDEAAREAITAAIIEALKLQVNGG